MVWFKVDDRFPEHRKTRALRAAGRLDAIGLWTLCGAWTGGAGEDGFVPDSVVSTYAGNRAKAAKLVASLVDAGFAQHTVKHGEAGVQLHDYTGPDGKGWNPSAAELADKSRARAEAGRAGGRKSGEVRRLGTANRHDVQANASPDDEASASMLVEPRPDPTRPDEHFGYEVMSSRQPAEFGVG